MQQANYRNDGTMPQECKSFYRVVVGTHDYDGNPAWETWSTWDTQKKAYDAMRGYRAEWGGWDKGLTPIRIVRVRGDDETFIDETGAGLQEWARLVAEGEIEQGDM